MEENGYSAVAQEPNLGEGRAQQKKPARKRSSSSQKTRPQLSVTELERMLQSLLAVDADFAEVLKDRFKDQGTVYLKQGDAIIGVAMSAPAYDRLLKQ